MGDRLMEHTSKLIKGSLSSLLDNRRIALCITGSVGAVECAAIARGLMRHGAEVFVIMTKMAQKIIHAYLMEWATGNPVITELTGQIEHVTLAGKHDNHVDLILIAPATANTIGKIANGIDDTPVTTTVSSGIGAGIPVVVVPAMHESMYDHPAVISNIERLREIGVDVMSPRLEEAKAKIPNAVAIIERVIGHFGPKDLQGQHFVLTAGPTRGWIDRVRFITNPSTGKMGIAMAMELMSRGASVTLILGPSSEKVPHGIDVVRVETSEDMLKVALSAVSKKAPRAFISSAAVLDYVPTEKQEEKIASGSKKLTVDLVPTKKIIEEVRKKHPDLMIVGFKVEAGVTDEDLEKRARSKIDAGICNIVVANDSQRAGVAFGTETNEVLIVGPEGLIEKVALKSKREVSKHIVDAIVGLK